MREVNFVKGLIVERVRAVGRKDHVKYHTAILPPCVPISDDEALLMPAVQHHVVPVHHLRHAPGDLRNDLFIAYSKDVQDFLKMPFDALRDENDRLVGEISAVRQAPWRKRLKFLFTGSLGSLLAQ